MPKIISLSHASPGIKEFHQQAIAQVPGRDALVVDNAYEMRTVLEKSGKPELVIVDIAWSAHCVVVLNECLPCEEARAVPVLIVGEPSRWDAENLRANMNIVGFLPVSAQGTPSFREAVEAFFALRDATPADEPVSEYMFSRVLGGIVRNIPDVALDPAAAHRRTAVFNQTDGPAAPLPAGM